MKTFATVLFVIYKREDLKEGIDGRCWPDMVEVD
jgi:hypothetical protein